MSEVFLIKQPTNQTTYKNDQCLTFTVIYKIKS